MNDSRSQAERDAVAAPVDLQRKRAELRTWAFLSLVMAPMLCVMTVAGYGFLVWMYQLLVGPPGS